MFKLLVILLIVRLVVLVGLIRNIGKEKMRCLAQFVHKLLYIVHINDLLRDKKYNNYDMRVQEVLYNMLSNPLNITMQEIIISEEEDLCVICPFEDMYINVIGFEKHEGRFLMLIQYIYRDDKKKIIKDNMYTPEAVMGTVKINNFEEYLKMLNDMENKTDKEYLNALLLIRVPGVLRFLVDGVYMRV